MHLDVRVSSTELSAIQGLAADSDLAVSEYVRSAALKMERAVQSATVQHDLYQLLILLKVGLATGDTASPVLKIQEILNELGEG